MSDSLDQERYESEIKSMVDRARVFMEENPGLKASVQFNFPSGVMVVATIKQALDEHLISTDAGGLQLLEAVQDGAKSEPTLIMLRVTLAALQDSGW